MSAASSPFATEAGHWYKADGTPAYEVPNRSKKVKCPECGGSLRGAEAKAVTLACTVCDEDGYTYPEMRGTTLRDARVLDLGPSVTGIIRIMAAPGLERYKLMQFAQAAWTAPPEIRGLDFQPWLEKVDADAKEHARQAAAKGTDIHATIERGLRGESLEGYIYAPWYHASIAALTAAFDGALPQFEPERSYTSDLGYGCKVDLICHPARLVGDVKTKDFEDGNDPEIQDDHCMQLAGNAVAAGLRGASGFILFADRKDPEPGRVPRVVVKMVTNEQMARGWEMFQHLLALWKLANNWRPSWSTL